MEEFKVFLSSFSQPKNFKNISIAGDFNFSSIIWEYGVGSVERNPAYGREINNTFLDTINEFGLEQQVRERTRGSHILDIVLSSQPHTIKYVTVTPGMSDHEAVIYLKCLLNSVGIIHNRGKSINSIKLTKRQSLWKPINLWNHFFKKILMIGLSMKICIFSE